MPRDIYSRPYLGRGKQKQQNIEIMASISELKCEGVQVAPNAYRSVQVSIDDFELKDLLSQFEIEDIVKAIGKEDLLNEIGLDAAIDHWGLDSNE